MGACIISDRLIDEVSRDGGQGASFSNGFTYSGHPVSAAAALKNIEIIEQEHILEHVQEISPYFQERLHALRELPIVADTRGIGLVGCVECSIGESGEDALELEKTIGARIDLHCQELGLLVRPIVNMCVFSPPLIISRSEIDEMYDRLVAGILEVLKEFGL